MVRYEAPDGRIRIGVSACLAGQKVRFDGGHKRDRRVTGVLSRYFQLVPVCPEAELGLGTPREPASLQGNPLAPRMIGNRTGEDFTDRLKAFSRKRVRRDDLSDIRGYILKKDSPSCGREKVRVTGPSGAVERTGIGLYAKVLTDRFPLLPIEEEGRLDDDRIRENFIVRVFAYDRLRTLLESRVTRKAVVDFHAAHKYLLMAHSPAHYRQLGRLVAAVSKYPPGEFREKYGALFMQALAVRSTAAKNVNVLQHLLGYLKRQITAEEKRRILSVIDDYRRGRIPLSTPIAVLRRYVDKFEIAYLADQVYLNPLPTELKLRGRK